MEENNYNIFLSPRAVEEIKKQIQRRKTPDVYIRLGVRGSGCSGFSYALQFDDKEPSTKDLQFDIDGVKVLVDIKSIVYLNNATLDWEHTLMFQGFKFVNPNESSKCGCGNSFNV
jgi:iron-sulfur cluster assembly protein